MGRSCALARTASRLLAVSAWLAFPSIAAPAPAYPWLATADPGQALARRIAVPEGYARIPVEDGSFAAWLRHLPLKPGRPPVLLHDGRRKVNQEAHAAVVDIDVGTRDLQQCADAVMRLRAEYLLSRGAHAAIHFNFTSGDRADWTRWRDGWRPTVRGSRVAWTRSAGVDGSRRAFRRYLDTVFMYAGTLSLSRELAAVPDPAAMRIGDVFIRGGSPGHAVLVVDRAVHRGTGRRIFLLVQSYMPAQEVHVLRNPAGGGRTPWYGADFGETLRTPEWTFRRDELRRFKDERP